MKPETVLAVFIALLSLTSCNTAAKKESDSVKKETKEFFVVPGEDADVDPELIKKGEVLVAYSDCYQCHREENKAKGPPFSDIARRYPIQDAYIDLLARKVISGGFGVWGYPVMSAHPNLAMDDVKAMVVYILSLEKK